MKRRAAVALRVEASAEPPPMVSTESDRQVLKFDFGRAQGPSKGPVTRREASTLKEAIIRWLDEQL